MKKGIPFGYSKTGTEGGMRAQATVYNGRETGCATLSAAGCDRAVRQRESAAVAAGGAGGGGGGTPEAVRPAA